MAFKSSKKLAGNIAALRLALSGQESYNSGEIEVLKNYAGFGGLKTVLFGGGPVEDWVQQNASANDLRMYPLFVELHQLLLEKLSADDYRSAKNAMKSSIMTAFYTPDLVPNALYAAMKDQEILPQRLYEPSSGAGIFITEALKAFSGLEEINAVEKDALTGKVLMAIALALPVNSIVQIRGFEETSPEERGKYDFITSNIPYGNLHVFDPAYKGSAITAKIHDYFFAKGLDKLGDGGLLAYLVTDAFLHTASNSLARKHVFTSTDLSECNHLTCRVIRQMAWGVNELIFNLWRNGVSPPEILLKNKQDMEDRLWQPS